MRLDKFIAEQTGLTRSQASKALKNGLVSVNGELVKSGSAKISKEDEIYYDGEPLTWVDEGQYFMLYKPQGYVCSHDDGEYPTVFQFFDYPLMNKLHTAGRLDVDTTGLVVCSPLF